QGIISKALTNEIRGAYFNSFVLTVDRTASIERVREAWDRLIDANAILRTVFLETPNGHVQAALKKSGITWERRTTELGEEIDEIIRTTRQDWISRNREQILHPMHLTHLTAAGSDMVILHIFHALYDGNSFDLMNDYASAFYHYQESQSAPEFLDALSHGP